MNEAKQKEIRNYVLPSGKVPFIDWLSSLDRIPRMRVRQRLDRVQLGNYGDYKSVGDDVLELKFTFGPGYRIYFTEQDETIVILLCAGDKKSQETDIEKAKLYLKELKERSNEKE